MKLSCAISLFSPLVLHRFSMWFTGSAINLISAHCTCNLIIFLLLVYSSYFSQAELLVVPWINQAYSVPSVNFLYAVPLSRTFLHTYYCYLYCIIVIYLFISVPSRFYVPRIKDYISFQCCIFINQCSASLVACQWVFVDWWHASCKNQCNIWS